MGRAIYVIILMLFLPYTAAAEAPATLKALDEALAAAVAEGAVPGASVAVVENGELVFARGYGFADVKNDVPVTEDTLFKAGSTSKNVTSLLALILAEEGRLDLNTPLREIDPAITPHNPYAEEHPIRLVHLLEHTAGLEGSTYNEYASSEMGYSPTAYAKRMAPKLKVRWEPGHYWSYANGGHTVAAAAMEKVTGETFDALVATRIFGPLGMQDATFTRAEVDAERLSKSYGPSGQGEQPHWDMLIRPSGSLIATPTDLAQIIRVYAKRGAIDGGKLVDAAALERMERTETTAASRVGAVKGFYGLGNFGFMEGEHLFQGHWGSTEGFRTHMGYSVPARGGYVVMANSDDGTSHRLRNLIAAYLTRDVPTPAPITMDTPPVDLAAAAGWYIPFSEIMPLRSWLFRILGPAHLSGSDEGMLIAKSPNPFIGTRIFEPRGGGLFASKGAHVPTAVIAEGADGAPVFVNNMTFKKVSFAEATAPLVIFVSGAIVSLVSILVGSVFGVRRLMGRESAAVASRVRVSLLLSGGAFVLTMVLFVATGMLGDWATMILMGTVTWLSLSIAALSLLGPVATVVAAYSVYRLPTEQRGLKVWGAFAALSLLGLWGLCAMNGWFPLLTFLE